MWAQARHRPAPGVRQPPAGAARRVGYWSLKMAIEALTANLAAVRARMERAAVVDVDGVTGIALTRHSEPRGADIVTGKGCALDGGCSRVGQQVAGQRRF